MSPSFEKGFFEKQAFVGMAAPFVMRAAKAIGSAGLGLGKSIVKKPLPYLGGGLTAMQVADDVKKGIQATQVGKDAFDQFSRGVSSVGPQF